MSEKPNNSAELLPPGSLDTPEVKAFYAKAEETAGDDRILRYVLKQQAKMNLYDPAMRDDGWYNLEPIQIMDNLYMIGTSYVTCFIFKTSEGLFMIDSGWTAMLVDPVLSGFKKLGLDPADVKYIACTHVGPDHCGGDYYFQKNFGTKIILSEEEWRMADYSEERDLRIKAAEERNFEAVEGDKKGKMIWPLKDIVGRDGDVYTLGDLKVRVFETPRRVSRGGLSYIVENVYDNGVPHVFATYGNTNVVGSPEDIAVYREAVRRFYNKTDKYNVDVVISDHPFVDDTITTMEELRNRKEGEKNPFVHDKGWALRFIKVLEYSAEVICARQKADLNESGNGKFVPNPRHKFDPKKL